VRTSHPDAIAYEVRARRAPSFRRLGRDFKRDQAMRIEASELTEAQRDFLVQSERDLVVVEILSRTEIDPRATTLGEDAAAAQAPDPLPAAASESTSETGKKRGKKGKAKG
jgi:hypothetical protein